MLKTIERDLINFKENIPENSDTIVVAMHGFDGSKKSSFISDLENGCLEKNVGLIKFDWPGHGEDNSVLSVKRGLLYLETITDHIKEKNEPKRIIAFATSFGGYLTLLFNYHHPDVFDQIILRSPAIKMDEILLKGVLKEEELIELDKNGSCETGKSKPIKITSDFVEELKENRLFELYDNKELQSVSIMHGTKDELAPFDDSKQFAEMHGCSFYPIEGANHTYSVNGTREIVLNKAKDLLGLMQE